MKGKPELWFIGIVVISLLIFFLFGYLLNIYEADIQASTRKLYADGLSESTIRVIPINSFGSRAPFRKLGTGFEIIEGADLIVVLHTDEEEGVFTIRAKSTVGRVVIRVTPQLAILPSEIVIFIYPNVA